jgi:hypothetical protein
VLPFYRLFELACANFHDCHGFTMRSFRIEHLLFSDVTAACG